MSRGRTGTPGARLRRGVVLLVLGLLLLALPDASRRPATWSLVKAESASAVDFGDGVVWVLALGSDARGPDPMTGRADAIQLLGVDVDRGRAVAVGIPRDFWVDLPGHGFSRINEGLRLEGPRLVAAAVEDLLGVTADYVVTVGFEGFTQLIDAIGGIDVHAAQGFQDPEHDLTVRRGRNPMTAEVALDFARSRYPLPGGDLDRSANHQAILEGSLRSVLAGQRREGFMDAAVLTALGSLDTDLTPGELYRFGHALTQVRLSAMTRCVLGGRPETVNTAQILLPDRAAARRVGEDVEQDARLDQSCP